MVKWAHFTQNYLSSSKMQVNLIFSLLMNASTSHILTRINLRKKCLIFGKWIFYENIAKIGSNWGILLIQNNRFFGFKKPVFGHWKLAKITGFPRPVKTGVSTLLSTLKIVESTCVGSTHSGCSKALLLLLRFLLIVWKIHLAPSLAFVRHIFDSYELSRPSLAS